MHHSPGSASREPSGLCSAGHHTTHTHTHAHTHQGYSGTTMARPTLPDNKVWNIILLTSLSDVFSIWNYQTSCHCDHIICHPNGHRERGVMGNHVGETGTDCLSGAVRSRQTRIHGFPRYCCLVSEPTAGRMSNYILSLTRGRREKSNEDLGRSLKTDRGGGRGTVLSTSPRRTHEATRLLRHHLCTSAPTAHGACLFPSLGVTSHATVRRCYLLAGAACPA